MRAPCPEEAPFRPRPIRPEDYLIIQEKLQQGGLRRVGKDVVYDAVERVARESTFHPIRDWLATLEWDGRERCYFPNILGARITNTPARWGACS